MIMETIKQPSRISREDINDLKEFKSVSQAINRGGPTRQAVRQIFHFYNPVVTNSNRLYEYILLTSTEMVPALLKSPNRNVYSLDQGLQMVNQLEAMWNAGDERAGNMRDLGITRDSFDQTKVAIEALFLKKKA